MASTAFPDDQELARMSARFAPSKLTADISKLDARGKATLKSLIAAARVMDEIYLIQLWSGNPALYASLKKDRTKLGRERLDYFWRNKGPWSDLDGHKAFLPGVPERKPLGANFYPEDMTREEFEKWAEKDKANGFFSVIRRDLKTKQLRVVPYHEEYKPQLTRAAALLRKAASTADNASLKKFLELRAKAFLDDDYRASDIAWLELDSPIDVTIGPYETYTDELFGYKAGFEAYVGIRDESASQKLKFFADRLQEIENNLPMEDRFKNRKLGSTVPIAVMNELIASGDGDHGVMTAAYNLPNDEAVVRSHGTKQVMMKNVQQAKFDRVLVPIAGKLLPSASKSDISFEWFFTHILAHELSHGIGPHDNVRQSLKELHSAIEEAKADVCGLFLLQYMFDKGLLPKAEKSVYTTFLASAFRSLRFGIEEAHGRGMALQFNYLVDKGAFVEGADGTFSVDFAKIQPAVRDLAHELLTIEANGDYPRAKKMLDEFAVMRPGLKRALDRLTDIPVDIRPDYATADELK